MIYNRRPVNTFYPQAFPGTGVQYKNSAPSIYKPRFFQTELNKYDLIDTTNSEEMRSFVDIMAKYLFKGEDVRNWGRKDSYGLFRRVYAPAFNKDFYNVLGKETLDYLKRSYVNPIKWGIDRGRFGAGLLQSTVINPLYNFSSVLDAVGGDNIVKALVINKGDPQALLDSVGAGGQGYKRFLYDFDIDNGFGKFFAELGAEVFSSPSTLISLGTFGLAKLGIATAQGTAETLIKGAAKVTDEAASSIAKRTLSMYSKNLKTPGALVDAYHKAISGAFKIGAIDQTTMMTLNEITPEFVDAISKKTISKSLFNTTKPLTAAYDAMQDTSKIARNITGYMTAIPYVWQGQKWARDKITDMWLKKYVLPGVDDALKKYGAKKITNYVAMANDIKASTAQRIRGQVAQKAVNKKILSAVLADLVSEDMDKIQAAVNSLIKSNKKGMELIDAVNEQIIKSTGLKLIRTPGMLPDDITYLEYLKKYLPENKELIEQVSNMEKVINYSLLKTDSTLNIDKGLKQAFDKHMENIDKATKLLQFEEASKVMRSKIMKDLKQRATSAEQNIQYETFAKAQADVRVQAKTTFVYNTVNNNNLKKFLQEIEDTLKQMTRQGVGFYANSGDLEYYTDQIVKLLNEIREDLTKGKWNYSALNSLRKQLNYIDTVLDDGAIDDLFIKQLEEFNEKIKKTWGGKLFEFLKTTEIHIDGNEKTKLLDDLITYEFMLSKHRVLMEYHISGKSPIYKNYKKFMDNDNLKNYFTEVEKELNTVLNQFKESDVSKTMEIKNLMQEIVLGFQEYKTTTEFFNTLNTYLNPEGSEVINPLYTMITDVLAGMSRKDIEYVITNNFKNYILDEVDTQIIIKSKMMRKIGTLSDYVENKFKDSWEVYKKEFGLQNEAHDAVYDSHMTFFLQKQLRPKLRKTGNHNFIYGAYDIEAASLDVQQAYPFQIGLVLPNAAGEPVTYRFALNKSLITTRLASMDDTVLQKIMNDYTTDPTLLRDKYLQRFSNYTKDEVFDSEEELFKAFFVRVNQAKKLIPNLKILGYNNIAYDNQVTRVGGQKFLGAAILEKEEAKNLLKIFEDTADMDLYRILFELKGVKLLTQEQRNVLGDYITDFINKKTNLVAGGVTRGAPGVVQSMKFLDVNLRENIKAFVENIHVRNAQKNIRKDKVGMFEDLDKLHKEIKQTYSEYVGKQNAFLNEFTVSKTLSDANGLYIGGNYYQTIMDYLSDNVATPYAYSVRKISDSNVLKQVFGADNADLLINRTDRSKAYAFAKKILNIDSKVKGLDFPFLNDPKQLSIVNRVLADLFGELLKIKRLPDSTTLKLITDTGSNLRMEYSKMIYLYRTLNRNIKKVKIDYAASPEIMGNIKSIEERLVLLMSSESNGYSLLQHVSGNTDMFNYENIWNKARHYKDTFWDHHEQKVLEGLMQEDIINAYKGVAIDIEVALKNLSILRDTAGLTGVLARSHMEVVSKIYRPWQKLVNYLKPSTVGLPYQLKKEAERRSLRDQENFMRAIKKSVGWRDAATIEHLLNLDPTNLKRTLYADYVGTFRFSTRSALHDETLNVRKALAGLALSRKEELLKNNINVIENKGTGFIEISLINNTTNRKELTSWWESVIKEGKQFTILEDMRLKNKSLELPLEIKLPRQLRETWDEIQKQMEYFTKGASRGTSGELFDKDNYKMLIETYSHPDTARNMFEFEFFPEATLRFNRSILGPIEDHQAYIPFGSGNVLKNYLNTIQSISGRIEKKTALTEVFFDESNNIASPNGLYRLLSVEEKWEMLKANKEYMLVGVIPDKRYGFIVKNFTVNNIEQFKILYKEAENLHLTVMSARDYLFVAKNLNDFGAGNTKLLKFFNEYFIGPMKAGYLSTMGFIFRNIVDTSIKNILLASESGSAVNMPKHILETAKNYRYYQSVLRSAHERSPTEMFSRHAVEEVYADTTLSKIVATEKDVLKLNTFGIYNVSVGEYLTEGQLISLKIPKTLFYLYHDNIEQGASAGMSKVTQDAIQKRVDEAREKTGDKKKLYEYIMKNPYTSNIMDANSSIEQVLRLAAYTWELEHGSTIDAATQKVLQYHFDYAPKTKAQYYAEYVVPFSAFTFNNLIFWMEALETHPIVAKLLFDFLDTSWKPNERNLSEHRYNQALQYHMTAGNIITERGSVVKINPSILDALRLLSNPKELLQRTAIYFRLPVEVLIDVIGGKKPDLVKLFFENIPLVGPLIQRFGPGGSAIKAFNRAETPLNRLVALGMPEIIGAALMVPSITGNVNLELGKRFYPRKGYIRKPYKKFNYTRFPKNLYPPYIKRPARSNAIKYQGHRITVMKDPRNIIRKVDKSIKKVGTPRLKTQFIPTTYYAYRNNLRVSWNYVRNS